MLAVTRFRVPPDAEPSFRALADAAASHYRSRPGNLSARVLLSMDEPGLWVLASDWANVGDYRRAFNGYDAKMILYPLMNWAIDEPGGYDTPDAVGANRPRGE